MIKSSPYNHFVRVDGRLATANAYCWFCGSPLVGRPKLSPRLRTVEHLQPIARGGSRLARENLVWACRDCNTMKGDYTLEEWRTRTGTGRFWGEIVTWQAPTGALQAEYERLVR